MYGLQSGQGLKYVELGSVIQQRLFGCSTDPKAGSQESGRQYLVIRSSAEGLCQQEGEHRLNEQGYDSGLYAVPAGVEVEVAKELVEAERLVVTGLQ